MSEHRNPVISNRVIDLAWALAADKHKRIQRKHIKDWLLGSHRIAVNNDVPALKEVRVCPEFQLDSFARLADLNGSQINCDAVHVLLLYLCGDVPFAYQDRHIDLFDTCVLDCLWMGEALKNIDYACSKYSKVPFERFPRVDMDPERRFRRFRRCAQLDALRNLSQGSP